MTSTLSTLVRKYDVAGPRYTSYPPAPIFSPTFRATEYRDAILHQEKNFTTNAIALYIHIPFCDTLCYFCGCTTIVTRNRNHLDAYLSALKQEIQFLAPLINPERKVVQMHWGGGTPTYLTPAQIEDLADLLGRSFKFDPEAEMSVEVDPRDLSFHHLRVLRERGFNRVSIGVQDFNPVVQKAVNRHQSEIVSRQAIEWSRRLGFSSINVDLIYGLPLQTVQSFRETLDKIIDIAPDRIAVYNFAYVPWLKKHQRLLHREDLPSSETKIDIFITTIERLTDAGYVYIGMDHFAKPEDELTIAQQTKTLHRNFQGYSTKAGADLYGLGLSSIGHFGTTYAQNAKTLTDYYAAIGGGDFATALGYRMTADDQVRKFVIMRLMCDLSVQKPEIEKTFSIDFDHYFEHSLQQLYPLAQDGLVGIESDQITVTPLGRLFLRNIAMCFDAYLADKEGKTLYSRTV